MILFPPQYVPAGENHTFTVEGKSRLARIVRPPVTSAHPPVVICFHGGGGQAYYAADEYAVHKNWPEALVYYAQGLPGRGGFTTWSARDAAFFDAMRSDAIHRFNADPRRLCVLGYSTGAYFCGDLWKRRGDRIAAFALISGGRYEHGWPIRPVYFSYATDEPGTAGLRALGTKMAKSLKVVIVPRVGGHAYPQSQNAEIAKFFRISCQ